jgi:hypothetical protein
MNFLQYRDNTLAQRICSDNFLPRASRFDQLPDLEWSFGNVGVNDKARFLATLYIEDIGDLIKDGITPYFGFSRYAEKLGMSAHSFSPIDQALQQPENIIETWMLELLKTLIEEQRPDVVGLTIPFPEICAALKCGHYIKRNYPPSKLSAVAGVNRNCGSFPSLRIQLSGLSPWTTVNARCWIFWVVGQTGEVSPERLN